MDTVWFEVLVVILSVMLALFLLLSIILLVRLIQIANKTKRIVEHAEEAVDKVEEIASFFEKTATPIALMKLVANISEKVTSAADNINKRKKGKK